MIIRQALFETRHYIKRIKSFSLSRLFQAGEVFHSNDSFLWWFSPMCLHKKDFLHSQRKVVCTTWVHYFFHLFLPTKFPSIFTWRWREKRRGNHAASNNLLAAAFVRINAKRATTFQHKGARLNSARSLFRGSAEQNPQRKTALEFYDFQNLCNYFQRISFHDKLFLFVQNWQKKRQRRRHKDSYSPRKQLHNFRKKGPLHAASSSRAAKLKTFSAKILGKDSMTKMPVSLDFFLVLLCCSDFSPACLPCT